LSRPRAASTTSGYEDLDIITFEMLSVKMRQPDPHEEKKEYVKKTGLSKPVIGAFLMVLNRY